MYYNKIITAFVFAAILTANVFADDFRLWFYLPTNFLVDENVTKCELLLKRAAAAGYNGVLVTDSKFCRWGQLPERYVVNVKRFRDACRANNIKCYAAVCPIGYSNDFLNLDPNLAEGLPVVRAPFVVKDGQLVPEQRGVNLLKNGSFERSRNNKPIDWGFVDSPGNVTFIDEDVKTNGNCSLRMQDIGLGETKNGRAMQKLEVEPFQYYHVSVKLKTENFDSTGSMNITILGADGMSLNHHFPRVEKTQDWKQIDVTFNTLENKSVNIYFGVWGGGRGKVWWDDARVEPAGLVNVLRRDGTPITVTSDDGKTIYTEGEDYETIADPLMGTVPYLGGYNAWHEEPVVKIPAASRLKNGNKALVDYYHTSIIYGEQVGCCMSEPKTRELLRWQIEQVHKNLEPDGYFMSHDEIRQQGWDKSCRDTGKTPAEILAENVAFCVETIRREDPNKFIGVWSDMFDPTHNARKDGYYYLVKGKGAWYGSWSGLPKDVVVANWNFGEQVRKPSLKHFSERGNQQILAGYYDDDNVKENIQTWLRDAAEFKGITGAMYTTWTNNYEHLERFAEAVKAANDVIIAK